jgi:hypothetical protein
MTFDITNFSIGDMLRCGPGVRSAADGATSMEEAAQKVSGYLYESLVDGSTGERACVMVRFYKTHRYAELPPDLQRFADRQMGDGATADRTMRCLTLLATIGDRQEWCHRRRSRGHQAIPLPSPEIVRQAPMIAGLIEDMGLRISDVVAPNSDFVQDNERKTYNVFHVETAEGSRFIPAQEDFVIRYGVKSVVGFGGLLISGDLFSVILFSKARIPEASASRLRSLALDVKYVLFAVDKDRVFAV